MKELQSDASFVILPANKGRSTVILNREGSLEKCMDHIKNGPYQLLKKDPTTKIKAKTLKQLKALKDNEFTDNKLHYHLKTADLPAHRFYGQPNIHKLGVSISPVASNNGSLFYNLKKYIATMLQAQVKLKITTPRILTRFSNTSKMFPLKMAR